MTKYDEHIVDQAIDKFLILEWEAISEDQIQDMVSNWENDGGLLDILYNKGYTDDAGVSKAESMDFGDIVDYYADYYWFPKRKKELKKLWDDNVGEED